MTHACASKVKGLVVDTGATVLRESLSTLLTQHIMVRDIEPHCKKPTLLLQSVKHIARKRHTRMVSKPKLTDAELI